MDTNDNRNYGEIVNMKVLVTGGAGFIGSHVVDAYLAAGHEVLVIDDLSTGCRKNVNSKAKFYELDIQSQEVGSVFEQERPDYVNHLAAQIDVRRSLSEPIFDAKVNILGGINLLEQCVKHKVKKFIFASTGGAIYGQPERLPADEDTPPNPECHYAASKLSFEHYIELYQRLYDLPFTILRFPNVYGPRQSPMGEAGVCSILIGQMLDGISPTLYGFGEPLRDYVFVGDIARATVTALTKGDGEILNLGSGRGSSVLELFDTLKELLEFKGEPVLEPLRSGEIERVYLTGDRAEAVLGWHPEVNLREGLEQTIAHIRETLPIS